MAGALLRSFGHPAPLVADDLAAKLAALDAAGKLVCAWFIPLNNPTQYLTLAGSNVTTWAAAYGSQKVDVTEATNKPSWDATLFGGKGGVVFDGTNDRLSGTGNVVNWPNSSSDLYMLAATRQDAATAATARYALVYGSSTLNSRQIGVADLSSQRRSLLLAGSNSAQGAVGVFTGAHTVGAVIDVGGTSAVYFDGASDATVSTATASLPLTSVRLGAAAAGSSNFWQGVIVAAAVLNSTATLQDFLDLEALMRARLS